MPKPKEDDHFKKVEEEKKKIEDEGEEEETLECPEDPEAALLD